MGFFGDLASGISYLSPAGFLAKDAIDRQNQPVNLTAGVTHRARPLSEVIDSGVYSGDQYNTDWTKLERSAIGDVPTQYKGVFQSAYNAAGQPGEVGDQWFTSGTQELAEAFIDRYHQKTGKLPDVDMVKNFVATNLTPGYASKYFTEGGMPRDVTVAQIVDPYLEDKGLLAPPGENPQDAQAALQKEFDTIYSAGKENFLTDTEANYGAQKGTLVNDLAGQGMLQNPNSRISLDALEAAKNKDVTSGLNTLAISKATGQVDLAKTIQDLLQKQQTIKNQASQFNKTLAANREDSYFNQNLQNRGLSLAGTLGKLQADAARNDGTAGALGGATSGAIFGGTKAGLPGAIGGGLLGGLGGYFGSKR